MARPYPREFRDDVVRVARNREDGVTIEKIRRDRRREGLSTPELADRHGTYRRTVRQALADAVPPPRKVYPARPRPAIDEWAMVIDAWLLADKDGPRKQRHTARRIWQTGRRASSDVLEGDGVALRRRRRVELGLLHREVSVPQTHEAGTEAEVDFGEFYATIAGLVVKCWMFVRMSHSGKASHVAFGTQAQEAFLEGHVLAFEYFGGLPARIRYDNLKPAAIRVLKGRDRAESERFTALRSHFKDGVPDDDQVNHKRGARVMRRQPSPPRPPLRSTI